MQAGDRIGPYRIVKPLGEGGMGAVYLSEHVEQGSKVVVKVLPSQLESPEIKVRFKREIQAIAALSHPNIVRVIDHAMEGDLPYYVMPFVPAQDLRAFLATLGREVSSPRRRSNPPPQPAGFDAAKTIAAAELPARQRPGPLPAAGVSRVRSIVCDVCAALVHCHEHEVVHRDIKPDNVLVEDQTRRGILSDFGLAMVANLTNITRSRELIGTISYMPPEMLRGETVGPPSDIYQIGLVLYEAIAGDLPLRCDNPMTMATRRIDEEIPPLQSVNPAVSEPLDRAVMSALVADPAGRPATMAEFLEALRAAPVEPASRPASGSVRVSFSSMSGQLKRDELMAARARRTRSVAIAAGTGLALLTTAAVVLLDRQPRGPGPVPTDQPSRPAPARTAAAATLPASASAAAVLLQQAMSEIDAVREFRTLEHALRRRNAVRDRVVDSFREGTFKSIIRALETFCPNGPAYFADPGVPTLDKARTYKAIAPILLVDELLASCASSYRLPARQALGERFSPGTPDRRDLDRVELFDLPRTPMDFRVLQGEDKVLEKFDPTTFRTVSGIKENSWYASHTWTFSIPDTSRSTRARVVLESVRFSALGYASVEINDLVELVIPPPALRAVGKAESLLLSHTFPVAFLRNGKNTLGIRIRTAGAIFVANERFMFTRIGLDIQ